MGAPKDLNGNRYGQLMVIERAGRMQWGGLRPAWRCQCDCGRVEVYPQDRLPHRASIPKSHRVAACSVCRQPPCVQCGARVPLDRGKNNTCSEACEQTKQRTHQRAHWHRKMAEDPDHAMKQYRRKRQRMDNDPVYAAKMREQWREQSRRWRENLTDDERAAILDRQRAWYAENRDTILADRRRRLAAMSPDERAAYDEDMRRRGREWRRQWREWLEQHPEEKARYRARYREWVRERELRELLGTLEQLEENDSDD